MKPFAIALENCKKEINVGGILRSAFNFDASAIFIIGRRYRRQSSDTVNCLYKLPILHFDNWNEYYQHCPPWIHIGVEITNNAKNITNFVHPKSCVYIFGPEDGSISQTALQNCKYKIKIPTRRCLNLASTASIVMYDRISKENK